jgi:uncharacterized protein
MKFFERAGLVVVFLLASSGVAAGQSPGLPTAPDTTAMAWARRLLEAKHAEQALLTGFDSAFAAQRKRGGQQVPQVYFDSLVARARRDAPQLLDSLATVWAARLSSADLQDMVRFYESPLGQRYASAEISVELQSTGLAQRWGMRLALDVMRDLMDKGLMSASDLSH